MNAIREALDRWDNGDLVWSVEMGGLGPSYEQCIQIVAFEMLRELLASATEWPGIEVDPDADTTERMQKEMQAARDIAATRCERLGLSGAQVGAATNLAASIYRRGYQEALESVPDRDRLIQVSKSFPALVAPPPGRSRRGRQRRRFQPALLRAGVRGRA